MRVLKVEIDGVTTSFRHPHFLVGRQPSYPLPPPATIYGHIAGALGSFPDPAEIRFAYSFSYAGRVDDIENIYLVTVGGSVPHDARARWPYPVNIEATMNPVLREILFQPHLTLYLDAPRLLEELYEAFRSPKYMVVLGRSQDLASYRSVEVIETQDAEVGYAEGTLLPHSERDRFREAVTMMMPRYINPDNRRQVLWSPYLILERKAKVAARSMDERFTVDPNSPTLAGELRRILWWHTFVPDGEVSIAMGGITD